VNDSPERRFPDCKSQLRIIAPVTLRMPNLSYNLDFSGMSSAEADSPLAG